MNRIPIPAEDPQASSHVPGNHWASAAPVLPGKSWGLLSQLTPKWSKHREYTAMVALIWKKNVTF